MAILEAEGDWDVAVVGTDLAGPAAAASCVRRGMSVLVCEQSSEVGGIGHAFQRDGRIFDSAVRVLGEAEFVRAFTDWLDVGDVYELIALDTVYGASFAEVSMRRHPITEKEKS